jgi:hypothetical protein
MHLDCPRCHRNLEYQGDRPSFCSYCGASLSNQKAASTAAYDPEGPTLEPSQVSESKQWAPHPENIGGYRLLRTLGSGGMGRVYEAEEVASARKVAVKLLANELVSSQAVERFRQEGRLASAISHPRCVFVLAADEEAGRPYIVMELMQGSTLRDLVEKHGPLPPEKAVEKTLDIIDGLQAAHSLGVIHRDVKPSNCFLEADGRVKVGDFGLAKSVSADSSLTRTGAFLGTPLFASPEQIRCDAVDQQTDVYSVAATLYYLLCGQAPFEGTDSTATMARIVSDPPPPLRRNRPQVSAALERVVLRGLERHRDRRWPDLESFRNALLPFVPAELSIAGMGLRMAAYAIDYAPFWLLSKLLGLGLVLVVGLNAGWQGGPLPASPGMVIALLASLGIEWSRYVYYLVLEAVWGCSLGKRVLGLRVCTVTGSGPPGWRPALLRTLVFFALNGLTITVLGLAQLGWLPWDVPTTANFMGPMPLLGWLLMASTMRTRNGYRGLHEFASGTRTVALPWSERRGLFRRIPRGWMPPLTRPAGLPDRLGHFHIDGALRWDDNCKLLVGRDPSLKRSAWIRLYSADEPPLDCARQQVSRASRLRWLTSGRQADWQWDAFLAPQGVPLPEFVRAQGRLSWSQARPLIHDLLQELLQAVGDQTLPGSMSMDQIFVQADGQIQLVDLTQSGAGNKTGRPVAGGTRSTQPLSPDTEDKGEGKLRHGDGVDAHQSSEIRRDALELPAQQRALHVIGETAALLLEGQVRTDQSPNPVRAPLPDHAARMLNPLLTDRPIGTTLARLGVQFAETRGRQREVTSRWRAAHLTILGIATFIPMLIIFGMPMIVSNVIVLSRLAKPSQAYQETEAALKNLQQGSSRDLAAGLLNPAPGSALAAVAVWQDDQRLGEQLSQYIDREKKFVAALRESSGPVARAFLYLAETRQGKGWVDVQGKAEQPTITDAHPDFRGEALAQVRTPQSPLFVDSDLWKVAFMGIVICPVLWIAWTFLFRGGLTLRLMGIALQRGNGRPALRIQCAFRTLLVWAPVCGLLSLSVWLMLTHWAVWTPEQTSAWKLDLSLVLWFLALGLLPVYVIIALRLPNRAPHDRLAGTYLVPR